jgi:hypothetical protein
VTLADSFLAKLARRLLLGSAPFVWDTMPTTGRQAAQVFSFDVHMLAIDDQVRKLVVTRFVSSGSNS